MYSVRRRRRTKAPAKNQPHYAELRRDLEFELEALAPGDGRVGENTLQGLAPRARRRARQILEILRRMSSEAYGICVACRAPIAYERLSVLPETMLCAPCSWRREL